MASNAQRFDLATGKGMADMVEAAAQDLYLRYELGFVKNRDGQLMHEAAQDSLSEYVDFPHNFQLNTLSFVLGAVCAIVGERAKVASDAREG